MEAESTQGHVDMRYTDNPLRRIPTVGDLLWYRCPSGVVHYLILTVVERLGPNWMRLHFVADPT